MLGNGTGTELGVEVEAVTENRVKRVSEAKVLTFACFRDLFGGAVLLKQGCRRRLWEWDA